ncbi:MAG: efflux RND transporter periplasmic adaptor subunit [Candidatus Omnitrophica bacterium]|nr:efflux RND transporter periplasmic adaptor subunit [Candidatus Omnitrophota bacterium]
MAIKYWGFIGVLMIFLIGGHSVRLNAQDGQPPVKGRYYCPMHPNVTSDRPGVCPVCNMNLVLRKNHLHTGSGGGLKDYASLALDPHQQQLIGIRTVPVKKKQTEKIIRANGFVAHNVDLYKIQNEFIETYRQYVSIYRDYKRVGTRSRNWEVHRNLQTQLLEAEHKLVLLGLGSEQIQRLQDVKWWQSWEQPELEIFKNTDNYWVFAQVFERDLGFVEVGQKATVEIPAYHETLNGIVRSIGGAVDPQTRTVRALIEVIGYRGELTANMLAYVNIHSELGEYLVIPFDAVSDLGTRKIVFVERKAGVYEPVTIEVGFQGDGYWAVNKGIGENDRIVVDGNFLVDSESRLKAQLEFVDSPGESEAAHVH